MSDLMKKACIVILSLIIVLCSTLAAFASGSITYLQDADQFIIDPRTEGQEYEVPPADLFANFKEVMPGGYYEDYILIKNDASNKDAVKVYLRSEGTDEASKALLSHLTLKVSAEDGTEFFNASPDEPGTLADWVYIGSVTPGGRTKLCLALSVDNNLSNEFMDDSGELTWDIKVEGIGKPDNPETGDYTNVIIFVIVVASCFIMIRLLSKKKLNKHN